jgi:hypothetical protein
MRYRFAFVVGLAIGYVLGAKAGRERYEQLRKLARKAADSPAVQQAAAALQAQAAGYAKSAKGKVGGALHDRVPGMRHRDSNGHTGDQHYAGVPGTPDGPPAP